MNIESVKNIFMLFSGESDLERLSPVISLAVCETEKMMAENCPDGDIRLDFLCAAVANYRLQQINAARDRSESFYAGKMPVSPKNSGTLGYAEKLLSDYISLCGDLTKPRTFIFAGVSCGTEDLC